MVKINTIFTLLHYLVVFHYMKCGMEWYNLHVIYAVWTENYYNSRYILIDMGHRRIWWEHRKGLLSITIWIQWLIQCLKCGIATYIFAIIDRIRSIVLILFISSQSAEENITVKIALVLYQWWKNLFEYLSTASTSTTYFEDMDTNFIPVIQLYLSLQSEYL